MTDEAFEALREGFPITRNRAYLNNAAESPLPDFVRHATEEYLDRLAGEGASAFPAHLDRADRCRRRLSELTGLAPEGMALVKNTTQGVWLAAQSLPLEEGDHVLINELEFPANVLPWRIEADRRGWLVDVARAREGRVGLAELEEAFTERTRAVALSWVQFSTGDRFELESLSRLCRDRGAFLFVDAIQGVGALDFRPMAPFVDMVASGSHKWLLGLAGNGFFWCRPDLLEALRLANLGWTSVREPFRMGHAPDWRDDALRFEEGNQGWIGVYALDAAVGALLDLGPARVEERVLSLCEHLVRGLRRAGASLLSPWREGGRSGIVVFRSPEEEAEALHARLEAAGVVTALRGGGIRVSPHAYNDFDDVNRLLEVLAAGPRRNP